ncbi:MAG: hypothetical protein R6V35_01485 [Candidatus Nanohaloarchaea archaeon]
MRPEKVFKRYDIRGEYPEEIDEEFAERLGKALGTFSARNYSGKIVVCRDNKESSEPLKTALIEGLNSVGTDVVDVGVGPTDYAAWCGKKENSISVQVTSSHMPLNFNGFKFMYPQGNGFVNEDLYTVQDLFRKNNFTSQSGEVTQNNLIEEYKKEILEFASKFGEASGKKIVFESMGGEARILPELLESQNHEVIDISDKERPYIDPPHPKPENLEPLKEKVEKEDADLGLAFDLDSDRITVYHQDKFLTGDEIFGILAQLVEGKIVASIDTSKALEEFGEIDYTRVGDPFVMDRALEIDAELAGEPNGHYSFTDFIPYNSGILAALILSKLNLAERLDRIPDYHVERESIEVKDKEKVIEDLKEEVEVISDLDGVKFQEEDAEVLVRPSGSSPKVRVIAEAESEKEASKALDKTLDRINQF